MSVLLFQNKESGPKMKIHIYVRDWNVTNVQKNQPDAKKPGSEYKLQYQQYNNISPKFKINYVSSRNQIRNIPPT
jgi:hypothetical protein